jgi:MarR family transcriptional regulator for hemolysin
LSIVYDGRHAREVFLKAVTNGHGDRAEPSAGPRRAVPRVGLGVLLRTADMAFNRVLREELGRHDVTFSQFQHLWQLWNHDGLAQVELSRRIGIETASSTEVLDQLERSGLIRRRRDPADRRRLNVTLTVAGRALQRRLTECAAGVNALARKGLSNRDVSTLFAIMDTIIDNLRSTPAAEPERRASAPGSGRKLQRAPAK